MDWNNKEEVREYMREYRRTHNSNKKYYDSHKEEISEKQKAYREKNKEKISTYHKEYRLKNADKIREYKDSHREEAKEYNKRYYLEHRESELKRKTEYYKEYSKTQMGRAQNQIQTYKLMDERNGFGKDKIDFNARWIVENIYTKPCAHCGETDWHKLGCNRIDNSKPHKKDNVESCCFHCNCVLNGLESDIGEKTAKKIIQYTKDGEFVKEWASMAEADRNGFNFKNISACCRGKRKTHHGYIWKFA